MSFPCRLFALFLGSRKIQTLPARRHATIMKASTMPISVSPTNSSPQASPLQRSAFFSRFCSIPLLLALSLVLALALAGCKRGSADKSKDAKGAKSDQKTTETLQGKKDAKDAKVAGRKSGRKNIETKTGKDNKPSEFLTPIFAKKLARGEMLVTVSTTASVVPIRTETLETMESGIVVFSKAWEEGDAVTSGALIATLDNEDLRKEIQSYQKDLEIRREDLRMSTTRLRQSEREYEILQDLYSRGLAPLKDVESAKLSRDTQRNSLRQSQINLTKAELTLASNRRRLDYLEIRAPFSGILVSRATIEGRSGMAKTFGAEPLRKLEGRFVGKNTSLCGLMDIRKVLLTCDVTTKDIAKVRPGQKAFGIVYGKENIEVEGEVISVSSNVNSETRAFEVAVEVPNKGERLRPGMFGRIEIIVQRIPDALAIPKTIVQQRGDKDIVFVVERPADLPNPVARERAVELGVETKELVEVTFGLAAGEEVVVRGYEILQDKIPVQVSYADEPTT